MALSVRERETDRQKDRQKHKHRLIHSFIQAISIAPLQVHYYSSVLDTAGILCWSFTPNRHNLGKFSTRKQLRVENLPKVPTWRLKRASNPRPFGRKASMHQCATTPNKHRHGQQTHT